MSKANVNSMESRQFINWKIFEFRTKRKDLEKALSNSPELSNELKDAKRRWLVKALREETKTEEYQRHLWKVLEDSRIIKAFAKQKFWENPTKDQIDEIRTQFYWTEMDYNDIDSYKWNNRAKYIVDKFWDTEKTLILLAEYGEWNYLEKTYLDQSSLVQQWKKFFDEPLWNEYDNLTTRESVRYHFWNTLQGDVIILKKFWYISSSSQLNNLILEYFIRKAPEWLLDQKFIKGLGLDKATSLYKKFNEEWQKEIKHTVERIKQQEEQEKEEKRRKEEEKEKEMKKEARLDALKKTGKIVSAPIWFPIECLIYLGAEAFHPDFWYFWRDERKKRRRHRKVKREERREERKKNNR